MTNLHHAQGKNPDRIQTESGCRRGVVIFRKHGSRTAGYTLLEICLAMVVVAVTVGAMMPLTQGLISEERLRKLANDLGDVASTARKLAIREGRTYVVQFAGETVSLAPWPGEGVALDEVLAIELPKKAEVSVRHDDSERWRHELIWLFHPGGLTDPLQLQLREGSSWTIRVFSPLTALSREEAAHFQ